MILISKFLIGSKVFCNFVKQESSVEIIDHHTDEVENSSRLNTFCSYEQNRNFNMSNYLNENEIVESIASTSSSVIQTADERKQLYHERFPILYSFFVKKK